MIKNLSFSYDTESGEIKYSNPDDLSLFEAFGIVECFKVQLAFDYQEKNIFVLP